MDERYHRQSLIKGWDQSKLGDAKVSVVGSGPLTDFLLTDLLSIGVGSVIHIGKKYMPLEFEKINPLVNYTSREEEISNPFSADAIIPEDSWVIESSGDEQSKLAVQELMKQRAGQFVDISCSDSAFGYKVNGRTENLRGTESFVSPMIASALLTDELRKRILPLSGDESLESFSIDGLAFPTGLERRIFQVGAGAIGTFTGVFLAYSGARGTIVDFDNIEETNMNRQFLFYDSVGKNKAEALVERLSPNNLAHLNKKIIGKLDLPNFGAIFSCVDNNLARFYLNQTARESEIMLVNGGSSVDGAEASVYVPGKTGCLDCQTGYALTKSLEELQVKRAVGDCFHPSLIISNQIAAGMMLNCYAQALRGNYVGMRFSSGSGIGVSEIEEKCFRECRR